MFKIMKIMWLQAVHFVVMRPNFCCTLRVCEVVFNLLESLVDMGVLKPCDSNNEETDSPESNERVKPKEAVNTPQGLVMNCIVR